MRDQPRHPGRFDHRCGRVTLIGQLKRRKQFSTENTDLDFVLGRVWNQRLTGESWP